MLLSVVSLSSDSVLCSAASRIRNNLEGSSEAITGIGFVLFAKYVKYIYTLDVLVFTFALFMLHKAILRRVEQLFDKE